jgi:hypothetical protein
MKVLKGLCIIIAVSTASAAVLYVPADYPTIQGALVNVTANDTVLVSSGTYYEHIVWPNTQGIVLMSEHGADSTVIDAIGTLRCITMNTSIDTNTIIDGFTIKNGSADKGGGIYCLGGGPVIRNNIICNNSASQKGGGIYCEESRAKIINNIITSNTGGDGGGFGCFLCAPSIIDNTITENSADGMYGVGGGISAVDAYEIEISDNNISDNSANSHGGGIYFFKSFAYIDYNDIIGNTGTTSYGQGISFYQSGGVLHYNNIAGNGYGVYVGGIIDTVDAEYNWWGDSAGPYHTTNPGGIGDTVSDNVDFVPWLYTPYGIEEQTEYSISPHTHTLKVYPNPSKRSCTFEYAIVNKSFVSIAIYDNTGALLRQLINEYHTPGVYQRYLDGASLAQGVYFIKLRTRDQVQVEKFLLIK